MLSAGAPPAMSSGGSTGVKPAFAAASARDETLCCKPSVRMLVSSGIFDRSTRTTATRVTNQRYQRSCASARLEGLTNATTSAAVATIAA